MNLESDTSSKLDEAILYLCDDINKNLKIINWKNISEDDLLFELTISILGSQCTYELALAATEELEKAGLFDNPVSRYSKSQYHIKVLDVLSKPINREDWGVKSHRYRFYNSRSVFIADSIFEIYTKYGSIINLLYCSAESNCVRKKLIEIIKGFGPKQASHFLRNIGYDENIAVLDTHILNYMHLKGALKKPVKSIPNLKLYETIETLLKELIIQFNYTLACIDQAIWVVMRVYSRGNI